MSGLPCVLRYNNTTCGTDIRLNKGSQIRSRSRIPLSAPVVEVDGKLVLKDDLIAPGRSRLGKVEAKSVSAEVLESKSVSAESLEAKSVSAESLESKRIYTESIVSSTPLEIGGSRVDMEGERFNFKTRLPPLTSSGFLPFQLSLTPSSVSVVAVSSEPAAADICPPPNEQCQCQNGVIICGEQGDGSPTMASTNGLRIAVTLPSIVTFDTTSITSYGDYSLESKGTLSITSPHILVNGQPLTQTASFSDIREASVDGGASLVSDDWTFRPLYQASVGTMDAELLDGAVVVKGPGQYQITSYSCFYAEAGAVISVAGLSIGDSVIPGSIVYGSGYSRISTTVVVGDTPVTLALQYKTNTSSPTGLGLASGLTHNMYASLELLRLPQ